MRIVHAVRSDGFAGVERHVVTVAIGQARRGHEVTVIGGQPDRMRAHLGPPGVSWAPASTTMDVARRLARHRSASVVNAHMTAAELGALLSHLIAPVPVVSTRHFGGRRGSGRVTRVAGLAASRVIAAQIAISRYVASQVEGRSVVVTPGVSAIDDTPAPGQRDHVVLIAQRLEPEKSTETGIRIWAASGLAEHGWRLDVAGDGSRRDELETLTHRLGVARSVRFLGARDDVADLMARSAVLLAPCAIDGFGLSVVEAMAAGTPVVAAAGGGHLETIGAVGSAAALYPPDDVDAGATTLAHLVADTASLDAYGCALRAVQRTSFTIDQQVESTLSVYRSVLR